MRSALKGSSPFSRSAQFFLVALILTAGFLFILLRLLVIQGVQYDKWHRLARRQHEQKISDHVERGTLYDRHGKVLAINVDVPSLYAVPEKIKNLQETANRLAPHLNKTPDLLLQKLKRRQGFIWLARKMDPNRADKIKALNLPGIDFLTESKRFYPTGALFGHIVGFTGIDNQGMEGIEHRYEKWLRGKAGEVIVVRDAYGQSIYPAGFDYTPPARGGDLVLTLDETIQHIAARELRQAVIRTSAKRGTVIVMNPHDGAILAMVVDPPFDPNTLARYRPADWRNRAITDMYEPGSTFKIVTAAAALEEGLVQPDEIIDCESGTLSVNGTVIHDHHPVGKVPFVSVIGKSSNIGMVKVASRLGNEKLAAYAKAFGFGSKREIDLTGESSGLLRDIGQWSERSLASIAIGQEVGVTPLQMTVGMAVIANGGFRVTPHVAPTRGGEATAPGGRRRSNDAFDVIGHNVADSLVPPAGGGTGHSETTAPAGRCRSTDVCGVTEHNVFGGFAPPRGGGGLGVPVGTSPRRERVLSEKTAYTMTQILKGVVSKEGTGRRAAIPGFTVAGKTGTAQKVDPVTGRYSEDKYMSSFVGFVPADRPILTIFVMLDEPETETFGGEVAAPVFSAIGRESLHYLKIPPMPPNLEKI